MKTICTICFSVNEVPSDDIGWLVSCPQCKGEYVAMEDHRGASTAEEKSLSERTSKISNAFGTAFAIFVMIGLPLILIGGGIAGCKYLVNRSETAKQQKEQQRAKAIADYEAKYPTSTSTNDNAGSAYQSRGSEWYSGGTLHRSTMREWRQASYSDRLATSADFSATQLKKQGRSIRNMNELRPIAVSLEAAISEAGRGGAADTQSAASIAAACWILLNK